MKRLISILLMILILSTGCTSFLTVDEDKVKDVSDKVTDILINTMGQEKAGKHESHTIESSDKNTLSIKGTVGDINISSHQAEQTIINIIIRAKSGSKDKSNDIIQNYTYTINADTSSIAVDTSFKEAYKDINLTVDLDIYIPANITSIELSTNVGNIHLSEISGNIQTNNNVGDFTADKSEGSYIIKSNVGKIMLNDCIAFGNSEFITNTGEIELSLTDISKAVSIIAITDVGNIDMSLKGDSAYHATINEFMKDERIQTKHDQGTNINLTSGVGKVNFK